MSEGGCGVVWSEVKEEGRAERGPGDMSGTQRRSRLRGGASKVHPEDRLPAGESNEEASELTQSACLRRKAGISISSMPLLDSASTLAAAWVRLVRQTLGTFMPV